MVKKRRDHGKLVMTKLSYATKLQLALTAPEQLFAAVKKEDLWPSIQFMSVTTLLTITLSLTLFFFMFFLSIGPVAIIIAPLLATFLLVIPKFPLALSIFGLFFLVIPPLLIPFLNFIRSAIIHLFVKFFKGTGDYTATYKVLAYSSVVMIPGAAAGIMTLLSPPLRMIAGILFPVWGIYIVTTGISLLHRISKTQALFAVLIPVLLLLISLGSIIL